MMNPRRILIGASLIATLGLTGCAQETPAPIPTVAAPVEVTPAAQLEGGLIASVRVEPARTADLAFLITGRVKEVRVTAGQKVKAGQELIALEAPALEEAAASARAERDSAALNQHLQEFSRQYKVWNGRKWIWTRGLREVRDLADARLLQAEGALAVTQAELAQSVLLAPYDGTVVAVHVAPGESVEPNEAVIVFADLGRMQLVTTDLSERQIADVQVGQAATVLLKAFAEPLTGKVTALAAMTEKSEDGDTLTKVTIELDQPLDALFWGMTGEAQIAVGK